MQAITLTIRAIGNSKVIVLPKPVLAQVGLEGASNVAMTVEHGAIILAQARRASPCGLGRSSSIVRCARRR